MRTLWNETWLETPAPAPVPGSMLLRVTASAPVERVRVPTGRVIRDPYRKAARFLVTDGPASTLRKVRSKREDQRLQGDYRIVAVLGEPVDGEGGGSGQAHLALSARSAPSAELILVHEDLALPAAGSTAGLVAFAERLASDSEALARLCTQSFLYSGERPPDELTELVAAAAAHAAGASGDPSPASSVTVTTPTAGTGATSTLLRLGREARGEGIAVAVLGAGDYARTEIVPALRGAGLRPWAVCDREPQIAAEVGRAAGFAVATTDAREAIDSLPEAGLVVVATAHDSHAALGAQALDAGHRAFVEKPPIVTGDDLELLTAAAGRHPGALEVGFNRRHHPLTARLAAAVERESGPLTITCVVREISIAANHWYLWPNQGTRVAGNLCHWLDLGVSLLERDVSPLEVTVSPPVRQHGASADAERVVSAVFDDGSLLSVIATDRGDDLRGVQETIDVRRGLLSGRIDDFRSLTLLRDGRARTARRLWRSKGHRRMFEACFARVAGGLPALYPATDLTRVALIQLAASALIAEGGSMRAEDALNARPATPATTA